MRQWTSRRTGRRKTGGVLLAATAMVSTVLVSATIGTSGAEAISTAVPVRCVAADSKTQETLNLAKALIGSDTVDVDLVASAPDIPANATPEQDINAQFNWAGTLDQNLVDKSAELGLSLNISDIKSKMSLRGPSSVESFEADGTNATITPVAGAPAALNLGTIGGPIKTTAGGIITYRVQGVTLTAALALSGQNFVLNLTCSPTGSNLIAKTAVKDPDAPVFNPEVVSVNAAAGGTATVDLLKDVISAGKTPLIGDSLKIVDQPSAGTAEIKDGVFTFTAPTEPGTYSTTVEMCGEPKPDSGQPGISEVQKLQLGDNWTDGVLGPRPVGFTLKSGDQESDIVWTARHSLGFPLPIGEKPTSENWAPADRAGVLNDYLLLMEFQAPSAGQVQRILEALPNIGAGNVQVTDLKENEARPDSVTGFKIEFVNELADQDVPQVSLGAWFSVPPQEILDSIGLAIADLAGSLGGDPDAPVNPVNAVADAANDAAKARAIADGKTEEQAAAIGKEAAGAAADKYIGDKLVASIFSGGPQVTDEDWSGWVDVRIIGPLTDAVPEIIAWLNTLFPKKVVTSTLVAGEAPTPPEPLCAQGIIDVTVEAPIVAPSTETPAAPGNGSNGANTQVQGTTKERPLGFTG